MKHFHNQKLLLLESKTVSELQNSIFLYSNLFGKVHGNFFFLFIDQALMLLKTKKVCH